MQAQPPNSQSVIQSQQKSQVFINASETKNIQEHIDLKCLLDKKLQQYDDVEESEFLIVEDNFQEELRKAKEYQLTYMHKNSNVIPIGTNYQALIPQILPEENYKMRSRQMLKRLMILKINDPVKLNAFISKHQEIITKYFQQFQLTEQDYSLMYNNYKQYGNEGDVAFQTYLEKTLVYWNKYFIGKQHKLALKQTTKKKKKKNKGSIPI